MDIYKTMTVLVPVPVPIRFALTCSQMRLVAVSLYFCLCSQILMCCSTCFPNLFGIKGFVVVNVVVVVRVWSHALNRFGSS
jgi:hypothetical protein